jgi:hypothetical protein
MLFAVEEYEALHGGSTQADDASFQHRHITNQGFNSKHAKYKLPSGSGSDQLVDGHTRNLHSLRTHLASTGAHLSLSPSLSLSVSLSLSLSVSLSLSLSLSDCLSLSLSLGDQLVDGHTRNLHSLRTHLASTGAHPTGSLRFRASWEDVMWYRPGLF